MASPSTATDPPIDHVLEYIRPAVRERHAYIVDAPENAPVKLNQNESPFDLPSELKAEIIEAIADIEFNRYPSEQPTRLRDALADYTGHAAEGIIIGNGSNELTYTFGQTMIDPGTPVVLPRPMFSLYEKVVRLSAGTLIDVPPRDDLRFDADALIEAVEEHEPALTVITSPNNPTGLVLPLDEIERIVQAAPGFVVVDEAYAEFNPEERADDLLRRYPNVILLRTFSKGLGLAGLRIGYLMAHPGVARELMKARLPFMVDRIAETVALMLLDRPELLRQRVEQITDSRTTLAEGLRAMDGVEPIPSHANFVLFRTGLPAPELTGRLADRGVIVRDMSGYRELTHHVRVNAGTPDENKAFLAALEDTLQAAQSTAP